MTSTGNSRILQIHPTRRCNLRCLHCYSSSSPEEHDQLGVALLLQAISDARTEGYTVVSFSGGEPLLYKPIWDLLEYAHQCQMLTSVASNGMLLNEQRLEKLHGRVDLLAISLDGMPTSHNMIRNTERAFEEMAARLEGVRNSGIPFGFIFTLTKQNFRELDWVANFAFEQGASLLQIHPLQEVGRAKNNLSKVRPKESHFAYAYLKAIRLQEAFGDKLRVQIDLAHQDFLRSNPHSIFVDLPHKENLDCSFAEILPLLIVEADGTVVPLQHGLARKYVLGNLQEAPLCELTKKWYQECYGSFLDLCQYVFEEVTKPSELPIINWYEAMALQAENS